MRRSGVQTFMQHNARRSSQNMEFGWDVCALCTRGWFLPVLHNALCTRGWYLPVLYNALCRAYTKVVLACARKRSCTADRISWWKCVDSVISLLWLCKCHGILKWVGKFIISSTGRRWWSAMCWQSCTCNLFEETTRLGNMLGLGPMPTIDNELTHVADTTALQLSKIVS